ncbi:MAG TPA: hypothetical protein V6D08_16355 [Candidatus Obscuribacterales bacterium]
MSRFSVLHSRINRCEEHHPPIATPAACLHVQLSRESRITARIKPGKYRNGLARQNRFRGRLDIKARTAGFDAGKFDRLGPGVVQRKGRFGYAATGYDTEWPPARC